MEDQVGYQHLPGLVPTRPHHPGALSTSDLTVGRKIRRNGCSTATITGTPDDRRFIEVLDTTDPVRPSTKAWSLADMGAEPYQGGLWNPTNYVTAE